MKTRTIVAESAREFDELVNAFNDSHGAKFTQTHIGFDNNGRAVRFVGVLFYEDK